MKMLHRRLRVIARIYNVFLRYNVATIPTLIIVFLPEQTPKKPHAFTPLLE